MQDEKIKLTKEQKLMHEMSESDNHHGQMILKEILAKMTLNG